MPRKKERASRFVEVESLEDYVRKHGGEPDDGEASDDTASEVPYKTLMMEVLGRVLSLVRRRLRIRQMDMAARLDWPQSVVSRIEKGEINVTIDQLYGWCRTLDMEAGQRGHDFNVSPVIVLEITNEVVDELFESGIFVLWGTARLAEPSNARLSAQALENFVVDHWPSRHRALL